MWALNQALDKDFVRVLMSRGSRRQHFDAAVATSRGRLELEALSLAILAAQY